MRANVYGFDFEFPALHLAFSDLLKALFPLAVVVIGPNGLVKTMLTRASALAS